jgi:AraC-like DNA-binding protein
LLVNPPQYSIPEPENYLDTMPAPTDSQDTAAKRVATEIRGLMGARNLTATDLANHLGVHRWTAARRIKGETDLSINELEAIAAWLDVPVTRLISPAAAGTSFSA